MKVLCPKCRALGSQTDCAERLIHAQEAAMNADEYELEVQLRFAVPVTSDLDLDPAQMATYMRERWLSSDVELGHLISALTLALADQDADLSVRPVFID